MINCIPITGKLISFFKIAEQEILLHRYQTFQLTRNFLTAQSYLPLIKNRWGAIEVLHYSTDMDMGSLFKTQSNPAHHDSNPTQQNPQKQQGYWTQPNPPIIHYNFLNHHLFSDPTKPTINMDMSDPTESNPIHGWTQPMTKCSLIYPDYFVSLFKQQALSQIKQHWTLLSWAFWNASCAINVIIRQ